MHSSLIRMQLWLDINRFKKNQADYFLYLSHLLRGSQGQFTVHSIFVADAQRYGLRHYRGRLSHHWLTLYESNGGDLSATWHSVLSTDAWLLIRASQARGDQAFLNALDALATQLQAFQQMRKQVMQLMWPAILAFFIFSLMWIIVPTYTVPQLMATFSAVPESYYGLYTLRLLGWANFSKSYGFILLILISFLAIGIIFSLSRYHGRWRRWLDFLEPWQSYKKTHALRLLALLSLLLNKSTTELRLSQAVQMINHGDNVWFNYQVNQIQTRILQGEVGAKSFETDLLSSDVFWFLQDMEKSQGIAKALQLTTRRLHVLLIEQLPIKAQIWRWVLLLSCVFALLIIAGWHYVVIDELRRALLMLYAS